MKQFFSLLFPLMVGLVITSCGANHEAAYCECLSAKNSKVIESLDRMMNNMAGDSLIAGKEFTSAIKAARTSGVEIDWEDQVPEEVFMELTEAVAHCNQVVRLKPGQAEKMLEFNNYLMSSDLSLSGLWEKANELYTEDELNSCEVKYAIFGILVSTYAHTGIEVQIPKSADSQNRAEIKAQVEIKMEGDQVQFKVNGEPFDGIDQYAETIDMEAIAHALAPDFPETLIVELKTGKDVPYVWPAQVIDLVKQNQWTIVLVYRTE